MPHDFFKKAAVAAALVSAVALSGSPAFAVAGSDTSAAATKIADKNFTKVYTEESTGEGMVLSVGDGTIAENKDGSVTISNKDGSEVKLRTAFLLSDGSVDKASYRVDGNTITVSYSESLVEGKRVSVVTQGWAGCAFGTVATIGSILSIPVKGVLDAAPAIMTAGAAAGMASYECVQIGK